MSGKWYICWKCRTAIHDDDDPDFDDTMVVLLNPTQYAAVAHLLPELLVAEFVPNPLVDILAEEEEEEEMPVPTWDKPEPPWKDED